ncbi:MAG: methionine--tRNA ligase [Melioribacteraceae bacterium]|nr:methionine--tRNA ligase [Melioribacteraceae bacterium]
MAEEKILVTSALPYANGPIHLGHLSGAYLPADIFVRYQRLKGTDIIYVCGSDEHGVPITITADNEGITPQEVIDRFHNINKDAFTKFGMSFDIYSRTSIPTHHKNAKEFFKCFYDAGLFNVKKSHQFYDEKSMRFLPDRYVEGTCPKCGYEEARSDECEKCGSLYDPSELVNPVSKISGSTPELRETSHWYFPLGKYEERLKKYIDEMNSKIGWKDNVLQYCKGWFHDGLKDRAITRDLDWGVKVPLDGIDDKVLYVWFEAVLGYISATKELSEKRGEPDLWKKYWKDKDTRYIAFIGKDNVVFHTIIFPAILMAWNDANPDDQYLYPENVPANEFLNFEGKKFSKSRGWGIDAIDFLNQFPADPLRYTLAANLPESKDTDFYWKEFQGRNNNELADILGNFVNRTFIFANKHFESKVPETGELLDIDKDMLSYIESQPKKIGELIEKYKIKDAVLEMMNLARAGNKYFNDSEPWVSIKQDKLRTATTINICLQTIYTLAEIMSPVIPESSTKIFNMLAARPVKWNDCGNANLKVGTQLNTSEILFTKIEDEAIDAQINKLGVVDGVVVEDAEDFKQIEFDDFVKIKLRVAEVLEAEKIKKSKKLLKLQVKIKGETRQVIAGIAEAYKPEDLIGKKVVMVANLKPAKLMGNESQGMILAVEGENGLSVVEVDKSIKNGTEVR